MTDIFDRAQELEQRQREAALAAFAQRTKQTGYASETHCIDCDEPIPEGRRQAQSGCVRCRECQDAYEYETGRK